MNRSKKLTINDCIRCIYNTHTNLGTFYCSRLNKRLEAEKHSWGYEITIPDWCPLEDAEVQE
jgi:hypothetical protein